MYTCDTEIEIHFLSNATEFNFSVRNPYNF